MSIFKHSFAKSNFVDPVECFAHNVWEQRGGIRANEGEKSQERFLLISISCNIIDILKAKRYKIKAKIWMNKPKRCKRQEIVNVVWPCDIELSFLPCSASAYAFSKWFTFFLCSNIFDDNFISFYVLSVILLIHLRGFNLPDRRERKGERWGKKKGNLFEIFYLFQATVEFSSRDLKSTAKIFNFACKWY